jgi:hypothetical protein
MAKSITELRTQKLQALDNAPPSTGRLQVRVGTDVEDLVKRLAIILGCKRAEVVTLAVREFADRIHPDIVNA